MREIFMRLLRFIGISVDFTRRHQNDYVVIEILNECLMGDGESLENFIEGAQKRYLQCQPIRNGEVIKHWTQSLNFKMDQYLSSTGHGPRRRTIQQEESVLKKIVQLQPELDRLQNEFYAQDFKITNIFRCLFRNENTLKSFRST